VLLHALDLARAIRTEDAELLADIAELNDALERCADGLPAHAEPRLEGVQARRAGPARLAVAAAAASMLGCNKSTAPTDTSPTVSVGTPQPSASGDTDEPDTTADDKAVALTMSANSGRWESCEKGEQRFHAFKGEVVLSDPSVKARFERVEVTDGKVEDLYVSPDGRRAHFILRTGKTKGRQRLAAIFKRSGAGSGTLRSHQAYYQYGDSGATLGADRKPEPKCSHICDMAAPPPDTVLTSDGDVVFSQQAYASSAGWAEGFRFGFGLQKKVNGELEGKPEVLCTTGKVSEPRPRNERSWRKDVKMLDLRDRFEVSFDPRPKDAQGRLKGGPHNCKVRYRLRQGQSVTSHEGTLELRIDSDGTVTLAPGAKGDKGTMLDPSRDRGAPDNSYPMLPLPLRYSVSVAMLERRGDVLVLGADCRAAEILGSPTYLWSTSAGEIEPLDDGRALWRPGDHDDRAVAVCAVQCRPYDLQIGSYRLEQQPS